jgi:hypothetical protein
MKLPCGCSKGIVRGSTLVLLLRLGWIGLFDRLHGGITLEADCGKPTCC